MSRHMFHFFQPYGQIFHFSSSTFHRSHYFPAFFPFIWRAFTYTRRVEGCEQKFLFMSRSSTLECLFFPFFIYQLLHSQKSAFQGYVQKFTCKIQYEQQLPGVDEYQASENWGHACGRMIVRFENKNIPLTKQYILTLQIYFCSW